MQEWSTFLAKPFIASLKIRVAIVVRTLGGCAQLLALTSRGKKRGKRWQYTSRSHSHVCVRVYGYYSDTRIHSLIQSDKPTGLDILCAAYHSVRPMIMKLQL